MIGVLTAFIGDLATQFGCTIGLKDSITAIVFVSLGTSAPGIYGIKKYEIIFEYFVKLSLNKIRYFC